MGKFVQRDCRIMLERKTLVISAVNLRQGGTLSILKDCLQYLSANVVSRDTRVVAIVHKKELCLFDGIEYIEIPSTIKGWSRRLWCEYVTMRQISKKLSPVHLWFSLHDTSPFVVSERQAVYCQTSFPFYKASLKDLYFSYKIVLFSLFTRFAYRINVQSNDYLVVQQPWLREGLSKMLNVSKDRFIVAPPRKSEVRIKPEQIQKKNYTFIYPAAPDCHKNFHVLCEAAAKLEKDVGQDKFTVVLTVNGEENKYTRWLKQQWGNVSSIFFAGFLSKEELYGYYEVADCLVFPSKVETWGLPISEFSEYGKPMLIADRPYSRGTAEGSMATAFFDPDDSDKLKGLMSSLLSGQKSQLESITRSEVQPPYADSWESLFNQLLV